MSLAGRSGSLVHSGLLGASNRRARGDAVDVSILRVEVAALRAKATSWSNVARITGKPEAWLKRTFGGVA